MKNIVIHVGMGKTGTTYLQQYVFPHLKNIYYGNRWKNEPIGEFLRKIKLINPILIDVQKERHIIDDFLDSIPEKTILISDEGLVGSAWENHNSQNYTAELLKKIFPNAKIFMVIRNQVDWFESSYNYAAQLGYPVTAKRYFNYRKGRFNDFTSPYMLPNVDVKQLNLYSFSKNYMRIFGKENVKILPYELFKKNNNAFLEKIYRFFDFSPFYPEKVQKSNEAYSMLSIHVAIFLNRFLVRPFNGCGFIIERPFFKNYLMPRYNKNLLYKVFCHISSRLSLRYFLKKTIDNIYYTKYRFFDEQKSRQIIDYYKASNKMLSDMIGIDLKEYGYY